MKVCITCKHMTDNGNQYLPDVAIKCEKANRSAMYERLQGECGRDGVNHEAMKPTDEISTHSHAKQFNN